jgi:hypothetical protein
MKLPITQLKKIEENASRPLSRAGCTGAELASDGWIWWMAKTATLSEQLQVPYL